MQMSDMAREDLNNLCGYILETEFSDFIEQLCTEPKCFPGLTEKEVDELWNISRRSEKAIELGTKAAKDVRNMHPYACAYRLQDELLKEIA